MAHAILVMAEEPFRGCITVMIKSALSSLLTTVHPFGCNWQSQGGCNNSVCSAAVIFGCAASLFAGVCCLGYIGMLHYDRLPEVCTKGCSLFMLPMPVLLLCRWQGLRGVMVTFIMTQST
jgi:hypothetical protein